MKNSYIFLSVCIYLIFNVQVFGKEDSQWPPKDGEHIITLLGPIYEAGRETKVPLFKALEQAMTAIVEKQQTHLPEFYQQRIAGMNHQRFRPGYSNDEEWGSIKSLSSKAEDYDSERIAGILESSEYRKPGLEMAIRMQPLSNQNPDSVNLEGYRFVLQPSGKGEAEWYTEEVKLKGREAGDAFRKAIVWLLAKPFAQAQKSFVLENEKVPFWKDKYTAGVLTFAKEEFTADAEPIRKETVNACLQTRLCPEMNVKGDEFVLVSKIADAQAICRMFGRELIDKETLLRLSLTEEGSNLLDEENGKAWHNGGLSGFFEEYYNHHDFTASSTHQGVVWCKLAKEEKPSKFAEHPPNYVLDRFGWWTMKLYNPVSVDFGRRTLDDEVEVEYLKYDNIYPRVIHARILKSSFSSDVAVQGNVVRVKNAPSKVIGFGFKRYTINVILSGTGWEKTIPDVPVRRVGMDFNFYKEDRGIWGILGGPSLSIGLSSPGFDVSVINHNTKENVEGSISLEGAYAKMGFKNYLKIVPNILWNVNMGIEKLKFEVTGGKGKTDLLSFNIDAGFQFIYKNIEFSLGQITYQPSSATFNSGCAREATDAEGGTYCLEGKAETETNSINIPAGTSLLMGVNYVF